MEGVTWISQEESLALPPFPRFSSSNNCRISTPFRWVFNLDPGKWLDMKEATIQLIQAAGWRSHCDKCRSLFAWAEPYPYMESEVLTVSYQTMPLSLFSHHPKYHRQILVILQSLEIRFLCLWIQMFLTHPGYTKPEALHNTESKVVLPSLQMVQHWIFK